MVQQNGFEIILAGGIRTAIGSLNGSLAGVTATELGAAVIKAALAKASIDASQVNEVILGNVLSTGLGQNPARQAALAAGLPKDVAAMTINKVCGSGLKAVMLAGQSVRCGDAEIVVAGGMENMSRAPYFLARARDGYRLGNGEIIDSILRDGLTDAYQQQPMGLYAERCAERLGFTREQQDDFAMASYERALTSTKTGMFDDEITPVATRVGKDNVSVSEDEEPKRFDAGKFRTLRTVFENDGTITAGNASSISDGAAAIVVTTSQCAEQVGLKPQARILGYCTAGIEPEWFTLAPITAIQRLLVRLQRTAKDIDLFEINEAFSVVTLAAMKELSISHEKVNVFGGAVALGHPIGASGARTLVTLLNAMQKRNARTGIVSLCIGGGEAVAMAVELVENS